MELTDFLIAMNGAVVLIESKASSSYMGKPHKATTVERSLTRRVHKAFKQLQNAQLVITEEPSLLADTRLYEHCVRAETVVSICVVDDTLMINPRSLMISLAQLGTSIEEIGMYILEIEDFFGLLTYSQSTQQLINLLVDLSRNIPSQGVPLFNIGF